MATLKIQFPAGRYHATPTGHHVNEGLVEWPPSPWRLVRALTACGFVTQRWTELPALARRLLEKLCTVLPEYRLPQAALGHSRHFMPTGGFDKGRERTTLVFDTFADVSDGELWVRWPVVLDTEEAELFAKLAAHLGYLGRSESWVLAEAVADSIVLPEEGRAFPNREGERPGPNYEQLSLVAPEQPDVYASWRKREMGEVASAWNEKRPGTKAQLKKRQNELEAKFPIDLLDAMQWDTARWKDANWSQAPGSRRVIYWRETGALEVSPPANPRRSGTAPVEALLLSLTTPSGSRSALPPIARTVPQAERLHRALVKKSGHDCPELSGRAEDGTPLRGHGHAHVLPLDLDGDARLDHILVFAPNKLSSLALHAARSMKRTYMKGGVAALQVAIAGEGDRDDLHKLDEQLGAIEKTLGRSRFWISATPFVPPRHLKPRGTNSLEGQVRAELASRQLDDSQVEVEVVPWTSETHQLRHVIRRRGKGAPQPPADLGFVLRLRFREEVRGPICLGYGSHFGLGRFVITNS